MRPQSDGARGYFGITSQRLDEGILVALSGEVDIATAPAAEDELRRAEESHALVVLDLRAVRFMDSTGLHMVLAAHNRLRARAGQLLVVPGSGQVRDLLHMTGLDDPLDFAEQGYVAALPDHADWPPRLLYRPTTHTGLRSARPTTKRHS